MGRTLRVVTLLVVCLSAFVPSLLAIPLQLPPNISTILAHIYSGRSDLALPEIHQLEAQQPDQPLGYLLEAEVEWWKIWCVSAEFKYGMTMARHHNKAAGDANYFELTSKAYSLAEQKLHDHDAADMHLYAAMADALAARLYAMRSEYRASARAGVRARENFQAALTLDPTLADAYTGLGLYNYYVDTLSMLAKTLRFLMGIPGGSKEEGIRQLQRGIRDGQLSSSLAQFYLALNLFNYDQKYEQALTVITPLSEKYPQNPIFLLMRGDLNAKLARTDSARQFYQAAGKAAEGVPDPECQSKLKQLVRESLSSLGQP